MNLSNCTGMLRPIVDTICKDSKYLLISIDMRLSFYSELFESGDSTLMHFLFFRKCEYGSCYTFYAQGENIYDANREPRNFWYQMKPEDWQNISQHDSCWLASVEQKIHKEYHRMADALLSEIKENDLGEWRENLAGERVSCRVRPCDLNLNFFIHTMKIVDAEAKLSPGKWPISIIKVVG